ncbi:peptidylprolyl isomerase [Gluconacetobacter takamatsuzukensis]|uniref:Parvulin-like PPIase n=1 Tax=Gluconacetobacter takamatsuzukensis TaxID=1286190 RepID=A0A7W4KFE6_9PROT|nr:peptidylprolyl isomerase [Gluconacetobacter takamatsuzukensis]MBB2205893.1 hypothetical protein [Gluconacetobacter takamatsuzukensis]
MISVNGIPIDEAALFREAARLRAAFAGEDPTLPPEERERQVRLWATENLIEQTLVREAAAAFTATALSDLTDGHIGMFRNRLFRDLPEIGLSAVRAAYDRRHPASLSPRKVSAAHIVRHVEPDGDATGAFGLMAAIFDRLMQGERFDVLAARYSDCPDDGGALGVVEPGDMVPGFDTVLFGLRESGISPPFRTVFGVHIVTVHRIIPPVRQPFDVCRAALAEALDHQQQEQAMDDWLRARRAVACVQGIAP